MSTKQKVSTTYRYRLSILGGIWWPMGAECSLECNGIKTFTDEISDDAELADALLVGSDGDFSEVIDFRCEVLRRMPCGHDEYVTIKDWQSEDIECRYYDTLGDSE